MFSKVLVPLDGSAVTQLILPYISQVAAGLNIPVSLLTVVETGSGESVPDRRSSLFKTVEKEAKVRLADTARQLAKDGVHAETTTAAGRPAEQIVGAAYREDCDFIAMSTHGQNVSIPGLLGSVADKVVHTSRVPVLSIAPARAEMYRGPRGAYEEHRTPARTHYVQDDGPSGRIASVGADASLRRESGS